MKDNKSSIIVLLLVALYVSASMGISTYLDINGKKDTNKTMNNSKIRDKEVKEKVEKDLLIINANEMVKIAQVAYADDSMNEDFQGEDGYCYTYDYLVNKWYMQKQKNIKGSIYIKDNKNLGQIVKKVWITDNVYSISAKDPSTVKTDDLIKSSSISNNCDGLGKLRQ